MTDIYEQHDKAFAKVSAFLILKGAERVATVAIKFPADGAGRLWAYTHFLGVQMTRAHADGYGYDKRTPAVCTAFRKALDHLAGARAETIAGIAELAGALDPHSGTEWPRQLENAGFTVLQAV